MSTRFNGTQAALAGFVVGLLIVPLLCSGDAVAGQSPESVSPSTAEPTPEQAPAALPIPRIPSRATADDEVLLRIRSELASEPQDEPEEIASRLPSVVEAVRRLSALPESAQPESQKLASLMRVRSDWQLQKTALDGWEQVLTRRSNSLEAAGEILGGMRRVWSHTQAAALEQEIPDALADRIESMLAAIDELESDRWARLNTLLTLQDRVAREQTTVNSTLERMAEAEQRRRVGRFGFDREPLWAAFSSSAGQPSLAAQVVEDWRQRVADLRDFAGRYRQRIGLHAGLFLFFLAILLVMRSGGRAQSMGDDGLAATQRVLSRPVSAAFLFAIVTTRLVYPSLPFVVIDVAVLAGLIPVLRLLPGLVGARFRAPLYALVGLFVVDRLVGLADEGTLVHRLLLLGLTGLGLALATWVLRSDRFAEVRRGPWRSLALGFVRLATAALAVSIVANVTGALSLARLLTRATLISSYVALVLFAAALALEGLVVFVLRSGLTRSLRLVDTYTEAARRWSVGAVRVVLVLAWLRVTLIALDAYEPVSGFLRSVLTRQWSYGGLAFSVGGVLTFVVALAIGLLASRFIPALVQEDVLSRTKMPLATRGTIALLVRYGILALAFFAAVAAAGFELGQFALIVGALGVGIGFGLQELVNNIVSGLILAFERPIRMGDTVQVGDLLGHVARIGIRASVVRTLEGAEVIVPNGHLLSSSVINWTLSDRRRRLEVAVGVAYGTKPGQVLEILERVAGESPRVLKTPEPLPLFRGFGDSSLDFVLRCWIADFEDGMSVRSEVTVAIHDALQDAGIEIPFPQRDLHVRSIDKAAGKTLTGRQLVDTKAE